MEGEFFSTALTASETSTSLLISGVAVQEIVSTSPASKVSESRDRKRKVGNVERILTFQRRCGP